MDVFNVTAGAASILGLVFSILAFAQARRASHAATAARNAVTLRSLADELELACISAEQLVDFLAHERFTDAALRIADLTSVLSEMPRRRGEYLGEEDRNSLLTSREQLKSIADAVDPRTGMLGENTDRGRVIMVARRVVMALREVLGAVKSKLESGAIT